MDRFDSRQPEPEFVRWCSQCGNEIYVGDGVTYFIDENVTHESCEWGYVARVFVNRHGVAGDGRE